MGSRSSCCAVCCAPPLLALLGIAGAGLAATVATIAFAGLVFGIVVGVAAIAAVVIKRRRETAAAMAGACEPLPSGPVEVSLTSRPTDTA